MNTPFPDILGGAPGPTMPAGVPSAPSAPLAQAGPLGPDAAVPSVPAAPGGGSRFAQIIAKLAPILAASAGGAMGGGQGAGAVLQGFARRSAALRAEKLQQDEIARGRVMDEQARQDRLTQQKQAALDRQADFRLKAITALAEIDDPAVFTQAATQLDEIGATAYGLKPGSITSSLTFSDKKRLLTDQKDAQTQLDQIKKLYGAKVWDTNPTVTFKGKQMKYRDLVALAGLQANNAAGDAVAPEVVDPEGKTQGSFDAQFADDLAAEETRQGRKLSPAERSALRLKSKKNYDATNDRDRVAPDNTWKKQSALTAYQTKFGAETIVKNFNEISAKAETIKEIVNGPQTGPGDLAIVFEFMKGLDPTSVVRETEYENAAKSGNIFKGIWAKFNGYLKAEGGFLPPEVKREFLRLVQVKLNAQTRQYNNLANEYARLIDGITGEPGTGKTHLINYSGAFPNVEGGTDGGGEVDDPAASAERKLQLRKIGPMAPVRSH